jgi:hypothetical protein
MLSSDLLAWIPALVVIGSMIAAEGGVRDQHPLLLATFFTALAAQWFGAVYSIPWLLGVLLQTVLALALVAREKMRR